MFSIRMEELVCHIKTINFYKIFAYFFFCALIGWIFETSVVFLDTGELTDRGLIFIGKDFSGYFSSLNNIPCIRKIPFIWGLPLIEIYGIGGIIIFGTMSKFKHKIGHLFFIGIFLMTLLELITSYFCDMVLHQTLWDYSNEFMNFQGRICLRSSLTWGVLSIFSVEYLKPKLDEIYKKEKYHKFFKQITIAVACYTFICIAFKIFLFKG